MGYPLPDEDRAEAVAYVDRHGMAAAERRYGVRAATIRSWCRSPTQPKAAVSIELVRQRLEASRARGEPWARAWRAALRYTVRDERAALEATADAWRRAYTGQPATPADLAIPALLAALAGEPPDGPRHAARLVA
ncbi:MAG: hypothetical protein ACR2KV_09880 [Solirubrobacteraceae bacterium]